MSSKHSGDCFLIQHDFALSALRSLKLLPPGPMAQANLFSRLWRSRSFDTAVGTGRFSLVRGPDCRKAFWTSPATKLIAYLGNLKRALKFDDWRLAAW